MDNWNWETWLKKCLSWEHGKESSTHTHFGCTLFAPPEAVSLVSKVIYLDLCVTSSLAQIKVLNNPIQLSSNSAAMLIGCMRHSLMGGRYGDLLKIRVPLLFPYFRSALQLHLALLKSDTQPMGDCVVQVGGPPYSAMVHFMRMPFYINCRIFP